MNSLLKQRSLIKQWPIALIVFIGFLLRITGLTHQSLWLDELHTMNEADPAISWNAMFHSLKCCDPHPPLYFIIERISFSLFGHTEFVARFISVLAGTASIAAMYWLGKELLNKSLGIIAAILTCLNFYNLFYSQEARCYIFAFLFAILSFLFFIRLIKSPGRKNAAWYAVFTLCMLYSHYYSLFVMVAQAIPGLICISQEKGAERKRMIRFFLLGAAIIVIGYIPLIPFLRAVIDIKSFWIATTDTAFLQTYFNDYFGNSPLHTLFLVGLLLIFIVRVTQESVRSTVQLRSNPSAFGFIILLTWVFITVLIPYIRSLSVIPMLFPRYTIVIVPAIILAVASGIELLGHSIVKYFVTSLVVIISLVNIFAEKKYYRAVSKTQFREMTEFIVKENESNYPIINEVTLWHQQYYLKKLGSKARTIAGKKESLVDSILAKSSVAYNLKGFWLAGAHEDKMLSEDVAKNLDTAYIRLKHKEFMGAWASLYVSKKENGQGYIFLPYDQFTDGAKMPEEKTVAIWNGAIHSKTIYFEKGKYNLTISARGDQGGGQYPHLNIYINDKKIGDYYVDTEMGNKVFLFENDTPGDVIVKIEMDNDFAQAGQGDRNAFIRSLLFELQPSIR